MSLRDIWRGLVSEFPLRIGQSQYPFALVPTLLPGSTTNTGQLVVPASGSLSAGIQVPNDCDLEVNQWVASWSSAGFPNTSGVTVNMYWGNREVMLTQAAIPLEMIFGTAMRPGRFGERPWRVAGTYGRGSAVPGFSTLGFDLTNSTNATNTVYLALTGWRSASAVAPIAAARA